MRTKSNTTELLNSFLDIGVQITQDLDIDQVLTVIVERAMDRTGAKYGAGVGLGVDGGISHFVHRGLTPEQVAMLPHLPRGLGLLGIVLETKEAVRCDRIADHPASVGFPDKHVPMHAFLGVPLQHRGQLVGGLYLSKPPGEESFTDEDEEFLKAVGSMAAVGIENARLFATERERAERSVLLGSIASKVRQSLDVGKVLDATVESLGRAAQVDRCYIRLAGAQGESGELDPIEIEWAAEGVTPLKQLPVTQFPVASLAALSRETEWSEDVSIDERLRDPALPGDFSNLLELGARAVLATPLSWGEQLMGVVAFQTVEPRKWTSADVALIEAAAREVSVALHHAQMYKDALETADRLRELDRLRSDFVSMVSHELRSPMTVVAGIADILKKRHNRLESDQRADLIETLGREARRLNRLVSEVLDLEAFDQNRVKLQLEPVNLGELAQEAVADAGFAHRTKLLLQEADLVAIVDRDRIKQVLLNLISNAAKFSGETFPITTEVMRRDDDIVLCVRDEGPGINPDEQAKLFQRFSRIENPNDRKPGTGLGLFLSRTIVEAHGGKIWVKSESGEGATFFFSLPRAPAG